MVAMPPKPSNAVGVTEVEGTKIDQAFIGSCTNGRLEDLGIAARILKGRKVDKFTKVIVIPASQEVFKAALAEGLIATFVEAGAVVGPPTCGPCMEAHMGILGSSLGVERQNKRPTGVFPGGIDGTQRTSLEVR
jgi:homoaconitase/3-isopropylmalate dehydratase large subunit